MPLNITSLKDWDNNNNNLKICIGIDIGGSGIRIRIVNFNNPNQTLDIGHMKAQTKNEALSIFSNIENEILKVDQNFQCLGASLAVAGPIDDDKCILTNWIGDAETRTISIKELPKRMFPENKTILLNDLEAGAYGIIAISKTGELEDKFEQLFIENSPKGDIISNHRSAVLAMGSGFGVALNKFTDKHQAIPTELGHLPISLSGQNNPYYNEEFELIQYVSEQCYDGKLTPEYEDICSGKGLCLAYKYFIEKETGNEFSSEIDAAEVALKAKKGDRVARDALFWHYKMFIRAAKEITTTLTCDSCIMALDNQVKNGWFINQVEDELKDEFYCFGRPDWQANIRCYSQKEKLNFNIYGAIYIANQIALI